MSDKIQFRVFGEWTAVYLNGELARVGDSYLADEWLQERCGVEVVEDPHQLCMADPWKAYPTLAEVEEREDAFKRRQVEAAHLREQAAELARRADQIETAR